MKSVKQNTIRQSIDRHRITLIESKQRFTTIFTSTKQRTRHADDGYKKNRPNMLLASEDIKQKQNEASATD